MDIYYVILYYLEAVNLLAFGAMGIDKYLARVHRERIPEAVLMCLPAIGGGIGALAGMLLFRHKIRKKRFSIGVPVILVMQIALVLCIILAVRE